jgi:hypothetical protein
MHGLLEYLADKTFKFTFNGFELDDINQLFPGFLEQIQFLSIRESINECCGIDIILNWLTKPSINGKQKTIEFQFGFNFHHELMTIINQIKEVNRK